MEPKLQTSFIPKKPLVQNTTAKPPRTLNFFTLISIVILATVLALAAGVYGYKKIVEKNIAQQKSDLDAQIKKFEPSLIAELTRLDSRIESSKELLNKHLALTQFFEFLSSATLPSVRFSSFSYEQDGAKILITMSGQAQSFSAVALQASEFERPIEQYKGFLKSPIFSDLNLDDSGNVIFDFTGEIDISRLNYRSLLTSTSTNAVNAMRSVTPAPVVQNDVGSTSVETTNTSSSRN